MLALERVCLGASGNGSTSTSDVGTGMFDYDIGGGTGTYDTGMVTGVNDTCCVNG